MNLLLFVIRHAAFRHSLFPCHLPDSRIISNQGSIQQSFHYNFQISLINDDLFPFRGLNSLRGRVREFIPK